MAERPLPCPEALTYVIGDIHGSLRPVERLMQAIEEDVEAMGAPTAHLVFVGDYVDRGENSAVVLDFLHIIDRDYPEHVTCLMGNHERMLLDFMADPLGRAKRWLRFGGAETLASYGIAMPGPAETLNAAERLDLAADLRAAMGPEKIAWLEALPLSWNSNNLWAVHAGADPEVPMNAQSGDTLLWGHPIRRFR